MNDDDIDRAARKIAERDNPQIAEGGEVADYFWEKYRDHYRSLVEIVLAEAGGVGADPFGLGDSGWIAYKVFDGRTQLPLRNDDIVVRRGEIYQPLPEGWTLIAKHEKQAEKQ